MRKTPVRKPPTNKNTRRSAEETLKGPYARILVPEDDGTYCADILEFPGCHAEGDTPDDAIRNLEEAAIAWIEAAFEQGQQIPSPVSAQGYSGKIHLRLPKTIHKQAARFAERDDISLNQFFAGAIAARVGAEDLCEHLSRRLEDRFAFTTNIVYVQQVAVSNFWQGIPGATFPVAQSIASKQSLSTDNLIDLSERVSVNG